MFTRFTTQVAFHPCLPNGTSNKPWLTFHPEPNQNSLEDDESDNVLPRATYHVLHVLS